VVGAALVLLAADGDEMVTADDDVEVLVAASAMSSWSALDRWGWGRPDVRGPAAGRDGPDVG
jgi:hypothetical protein